MSVPADDSWQDWIADLSLDLPEAWERFQEILCPVVDLLVSALPESPGGEARVHLIRSATTWLRSYLLQRGKLAEVALLVSSAQVPAAMFIAYCLAAIQRQFLWQPKTVASGWWVVSESVSSNPVLGEDVANRSRQIGVRVETFIRPVDPYGGDWYMLRAPADGRLWWFIGDTQGKSWKAWFLKRCVCRVWERVWQREHNLPSGLLASLHQTLEEAGELPEGFFVEATVGNIDRDGVAQVSSGGAGTLIVRKRRPSPTGCETKSRRIGGSLLGFIQAEPWLDTTVQLESSDALSCMSDGVTEQAFCGALLWPQMAALLAAVSAELHDDILRFYEAGVRENKQSDDTTLITIVRDQQPSLPADSQL